MHDPMIHPRRRAILTWVAATSALFCIPARAWAQSADAEALFTEGVELLKGGKIAEACVALEGSNRIEARAGTLIRLGECREKNHQLASAWSAYRDALNRVKDPAKRAIATAKIKELEGQLSYLIVAVPDESRVEGLQILRDRQPLDPALWNRATPVDGGTYVIAGKAPGHEEWQTTVEVPVSGGKVSVEVPRFKELAKLAPAGPGDATPPAQRDDDQEDAPRPPAGLSARRKIALGAAGGSVVSLGIGIAFGVSSRGLAQDADGLCPDRNSCERALDAADLARRARTRAIVANVAFGVSAVAAVGAGVLWVLGAEGEHRREVSVVPSVSSGATGVAVVGRF